MRARPRKAPALVCAVLVGAGAGAYGALAGASDAIAGKPAISAAPPKVTNRTSAAFAYTSRIPVAFRCSLDGGAFDPCGSGTNGASSYTGPLSDGPHSFRVVAMVGGSLGHPARRAWTIDTVPPPTPAIAESPAASTTATEGRFVYDDAEAKATFECRLDGGSFAGCREAKRYGGLGVGPHAFCVRALDRAGNASPPVCAEWQVVSSAVGFSISGSPLPGSVLYPGGPAVPINLVLVNPNPGPITVLDATVSVAGTSARRCAPDFFVVTQQLAVRPTLPANATASLAELGIPRDEWPQLSMADRGDQDACQHASVDLAYSGTAAG